LGIGNSISSIIKVNKGKEITEIELIEVKEV
jgi:hypothetical protein